MHIELLYFDGCPSRRIAAGHLRTLSDEFDDLTFSHTIVDTPELADRYGFRGSPSVLIDGVDPFADETDPVGLSCRLYQTPIGPAGSPTIDQLRLIVQAGLRSAEQRRP